MSEDLSDNDLADMERSAKARLREGEPQFKSYELAERIVRLVREVRELRGIVEAEFGTGRGNDLSGGIASGEGRKP